MRTVIVYESMYGNTHAVAERIAAAARARGEVALVPVVDASAETLAGADLVIVGGPTHMHGMSWGMTRNTAIADAEKKDEVEADPDAEGPGLRNWFHGVEKVDGTSAAAFDTRFDAAPSMTGRASKGISRRLHHHGFTVVAEPESFLVDKENHLVEGEADRAEAWAAAVLDQLATAGGAAPSS